MRVLDADNSCSLTRSPAEFCKTRKQLPMHNDVPLQGLKSRTGVVRTNSRLQLSFGLGLASMHIRRTVLGRQELVALGVPAPCRACRRLCSGHRLFGCCKFPGAPGPQRHSYRCMRKIVDGHLVSERLPSGAGLSQQRLHRQYQDSCDCVHSDIAKTLAVACTIFKVWARTTPRCPCH